MDSSTHSGFSASSGITTGRGLIGRCAKLIRGNNESDTTAISLYFCKVGFQMVKDLSVFLGAVRILVAGVGCVTFNYS